MQYSHVQQPVSYRVVVFISCLQDGHVIRTGLMLAEGWYGNMNWAILVSTLAGTAIVWIVTCAGKGTYSDGCCWMGCWWPYCADCCPGVPYKGRAGCGTTDADPNVDGSTNKKLEIRN